MEQLQGRSDRAAEFGQPISQPVSAANGQLDFEESAVEELRQEAATVTGPRAFRDLEHGPRSFFKSGGSFFYCNGSKRTSENLEKHIYKAPYQNFQLNKAHSAAGPPPPL